MKRINLLPPEQRVKAARELGAMYALFGLLLLVVVLGVIYVWQNGRISDKQAQVTALQADVAQVETQTAALQPYETLQSQRTSMADTAQADLRFARDLVEHPAGDQPGHTRHGAAHGPQCDRAAVHVGRRRSWWAARVRRQARRTSPSPATP